ncbi:MAG: hypothetical protein QXY50_07980 [Candidatus Caldarchaeum sp.]
MDPVAALTAILHSVYIVVLLLTATMHAVGRHENCRRDAAIVSALSIPVLATATVKAGGEMAGLLQTLQTVSVFSTLLAGLYMLASWLKTVNDKSFQNTGYSRVDDTYSKTVSADSVDEYPSVVFEGQAPASEQLRNGLDTPSPTSYTATLQHHLATASEVLKEVPQARHISSEVSTTLANITRRATAAHHSSEQLQQRTGEGQRLTDSEKRLTEMYVRERRLLERVAQRKQRKEAVPHSLPKNPSVKDLILNDRALIILSKRLNNKLHQEIRYKKKKRREHLMFIRHQDVKAIYIIKNNPSFKADWFTNRIRQRLKMLRLIEAKQQGIFLTERGEFIRHLICLAAEEMLKEIREGGKLAAKLNACND